MTTFDPNNPPAPPKPPESRIFYNGRWFNTETEFKQWKAQPFLKRLFS